MKAGFEFDFDDPMDIKAHLVHTKAHDMLFAITNFQFNTKDKLQIEDDTDHAASYNQGIDAALNCFSALLEDYNINVDELGG